MRLLNLKLRGAIGLKPYGEEVDIDYSQFNPGPIAIVGPNGSGKSSLLESSHPWPTLVSRCGSLKHHFHLRDSYRILELEYGGHVYKSKILIDAKNGKMEGYLYRDGQPLNDGKIPSYEEKIDEVFGSKLVFFKSVFAGQNAERLTALTPGMAKEFFIYLLGLDRYQAYADRAKEKTAAIALEISTLKAKAGMLESRIESMASRIAGRADVESEIDRITQSIENLETSLVTILSEIKAAEGAGERRRQVETQVKSVKATMAELEEEKGSTEKSKALAVSELNKEEDGLKAEIKRLEGLLASADEIRSAMARLDSLEDDCRDLDAALAGLQTLQKKKAELELAVMAELEPAKEELRKLEADRVKLSGRIDLDRAEALAELKKRESQLELAVSKEQDAIKANGKSLETEKGEIERQILSDNKAFGLKIDNLSETLKAKRALSESMAKVSCKDTPEFLSTCPLLSTARAAHESIEGLQTELRRLERDKLSDHPRQARLNEVIAETSRLAKNPPVPASRQAFELVKAQIANFTSEYTHPDESKLKELDDKIAHRKECPPAAPSQAEYDLTVAEIASYRYDSFLHIMVSKEIKTLRETNWEQKISEIDQAQALLAEKKDQLSRLVARSLSTVADFDARLQTIQGKLDEAGKELLGLELEIAMLPESDLPGLSARKIEVESSLGQERIRLGQEQGKLSEIDKLESDKAELDDELTAVQAAEAKASSDVSDWKLLETACGKNGLQALELDAAGPAISGIATEMIQAFGREWSISISTVRRSSDGKKDIETFDIMVSTPRGVENFDDLSGGEKVWVEESLRKAVTIYLIKNSGRDLRTLFQDESDGPLDPDRAQAFLDTSLRAHELTGAHHTLIITQRPEIWQRIDQRIELDPVKGAIKIVQGG